MRISCLVEFCLPLFALGFLRSSAIEKQDEPEGKDNADKEPPSTEGYPGEIEHSSWSLLNEIVLLVVLLGI